MNPQFFGGILVAGYLILHWLRQRKRKRALNVNGVWMPSGYVNGKPRYVKDGDDRDIHWEPDGWHIGDDVLRARELTTWIAEWDDETGNQ